ncbi:hypothetical protein KM043_011305 [Ampulex compressa]|nr:hypothetical protein KM043_011305 [Ampulex compressa]
METQGAYLWDRVRMMEISCGSADETHLAIELENSHSALEGATSSKRGKRGRTEEEIEKIVRWEVYFR